MWSFHLRQAFVAIVVALVSEEMLKKSAHHRSHWPASNKKSKVVVLCLVLNDEQWSLGGLPYRTTTCCRSLVFSIHHCPFGQKSRQNSNVWAIFITCHDETLVRQACGRLPAATNKTDVLSDGERSRHSYGGSAEITFGWKSNASAARDNLSAARDNHTIFFFSRLSLARFRRTTPLQKAWHFSFHNPRQSKCSRDQIGHWSDAKGRASIKNCVTIRSNITGHVQCVLGRDRREAADLYDTSNYSPDHQLFSDTNKKVIGKFKDELGGKVLTEFIGIRPKMYSYVGEDSGKRAKGVKKSVLKNTITHEDYKNCLIKNEVYSRDMPGLRSYKHTIHGETVHKIALAPLDTKRYILEDGITTLAFGHKDILPKTHCTPTPVQPPTLEFSLPPILS